MKQLKRQQPKFQENGPYREYTQQHEAMRVNNNKRLSLVAIPAVLYIFTQNTIFILIGGVYLAAALYLDRLQKHRLFAEYTKMEQQRLQELSEALSQMGIPPKRCMTFGYRRTQTAFEPVFLCRCENELFLMDNIFVKNCLYGVEGQMLYLLDINQEAFKKAPKTYAVSSLEWQPCQQTHQELLRAEGMRLNDFLIIESFIYAALLEEMKSGEEKQLLHTTFLLTKMKKERVYETELGNGIQLLLPKAAEDTLSLVRDGIDD
jgi:hypothetical protein